MFRQQLGFIVIIGTFGMSRVFKMSEKKRCKAAAMIKTRKPQT